VDWLFLLVLGLAVFLARDALLLSAFPRGAAIKATTAYAAAWVVVFAALGTAADHVSRDEALRLLRDARLWGPAVALHAALWFAFTRARSKGHGRGRVLWLVLAPAPVFVYCAGGLCWLALTAGGPRDATTAGGLLGCAWVALTVACCWGLRRFGSGEPRRDSGPRTDSEEPRTGAVLEFAAAANLSAILLLPLHQYSQQGTLADTAFPWGTTVTALAATAGLIGASFLFHRLRSTP
jgi:hypothetical protein